MRGRKGFMKDDVSEEEESRRRRPIFIIRERLDNPITVLLGRDESGA
jgi:hypothetical protein